MLIYFPQLRALFCSFTRSPRLFSCYPLFVCFCFRFLNTRTTSPSRSGRAYPLRTIAKTVSSQLQPLEKFPNRPGRAEIYSNLLKNKRTVLLRGHGEQEQKALTVSGAEPRGISITSCTLISNEHVAKNLTNETDTRTHAKTVA